MHPFPSFLNYCGRSGTFSIEGLRFAEGPIRCRHQCQWCENRCCYHSHTLAQEQRHEWYGQHKCFLHDENGYDYL